MLITIRHGYLPTDTDESDCTLGFSRHNCVTAMAGRIPSLGCGGGLGNKRPHERRVLYSFNGKKVQESWKLLLTSVSCPVAVDLYWMVGTESDLAICAGHVLI